MGIFIIKLTLWGELNIFSIIKIMSNQKYMYIHINIHLLHWTKPAKTSKLLGLLIFALLVYW